MHAQNEPNAELRRKYLDDAVKSLESAMNACYLDIEMVQKRFNRATRMPIFRQTKVIDRYVGFIAQDLQLLAKYNGILLQILDYMGKTKDTLYASSKYKTYMTDFCTKAIGSKQLPLSLQLHNAYSGYTKLSMDTWKTMTDEMVPLLNSSDTIEGLNIITAEDVVNE